MKPHAQRVRHENWPEMQGKFAHRERPWGLTIGQRLPAHSTSIVLIMQIHPTNTPGEMAELVMASG